MHCSKPAGRVTELAVHAPGLWSSLEHQPGAGWATAIADGGDRRLRRQVGVGSEGGPAGGVDNRFSLRLGCSDH